MKVAPPKSLADLLSSCSQRPAPAHTNTAARTGQCSLLLASLLILLAVTGATVFATVEDPKLVAETDPRSPEEQRKLFHLPPGFEIQLVASEPDIQKPMNIAFDSRARLWITNSVEYPFPAKPGATPRDSIKIIEDMDGDGRADRIKTFADGLNIPIGILPLADSNAGCVAYSIPSIYRFSDQDGDDRADTRDVLYSGFGSIDTHGMSSSYTWGLDGWIYATHGFANTSEVKGSDGHVVKMNSGNTYRFRPDGSRIEQWTWGQVNPFGLTFDPFGNLFSADCHSRPIMMLLRGAHYQSFGKPHDGLGFGPEICSHEHGSTGIAGIVYYAADLFPNEYRNTIFTGNPVTNRINHDRLEQHGSTFQTVHQPDFLSCDDPWFRPVDLKLGPDGAIYVADFYNRIIGHYEVPLTHPGRDHDRGRIWRIVYTGEDGSQKAAAPRRDWTKATLDELIDDLGDSNATVRMIATNQIVSRFGEGASGRLRQVTLGDASPLQQTHALWILHRFGTMVSRSDVDPLVRIHWLRAAGERTDIQPSLRDVIAGYLSGPDAGVERAAAESLARHPALENIVPLLRLRRGVPGNDPQLLHAVRMSLREQLRADGMFDALVKLNLDDTDVKNLADVVPGVPSQAAATWLNQYLHHNNESPATFTNYLAHVTRYISSERLSEIIAFARSSCDNDLRRQAATILVLHESLQARGEKVPNEILEWGAETGRKLIATNDVENAREAIRIARAVKIESLGEPILTIAAGQPQFEPLRADAISMLAEVQPEHSRGLLSEILGNS